MRQVLKLNKNRFNSVVAGFKKGTSRLGYRPIKLGELLLVMTEDETQSFFVNVVFVKHCLFKDVDIFEAQKEGYSSLEEMKDTLSEIYKKVIKDSDEFTLVRWQ